MPPPIANDGALPKQRDVRTDTSSRSTQIDSAVGPAAASELSTAIPAQSSYEVGQQGEALRKFSPSDPVGIAKILPAEGATQSSAPAQQMMQETAALERSNDVTWAQSSQGAPAQQPSSNATSTSLTVGGSASDVAVKHIVANMSDQTLQAQPNTGVSVQPSVENRQKDGFGVQRSSDSSTSRAAQTGSAPTSYADAAASPLRINSAASDTAVKHIINNMSDQTLQTQPTASVSVQPSVDSRHRDGFGTQRSSDTFVDRAAQAAPTSYANATASPARMNSSASDTAVKHIINNMSDSTQPVQPSRSAQEPTRQQSEGVSIGTTGSAASEIADQLVLPRNAQASNAQSQSKNQTVILADGAEQELQQAALMRTQQAISDLKALVDSLEEPHFLASEHALTDMAKPLDAHTVALMVSQARGTDLGHIDPHSVVYVLDTEPPTLVQDSAVTGRYTVFSISGEAKQHIDHAQAQKFVIDLGDGKFLGLDAGGLGKSALTLNPLGKQIVNALGSPVATAHGVNKKRVIGDKITSVAKLQDAQTSADACPTHCFMNQHPEHNEGSTSRPKRCVLCKHQ